MNVKDKLSILPDKPGCYFMKDKFGNVIYVGKAKNLKSRVRSYFTGAHNLKTAKLVSEIADFEFVITNSEQESLILELNLIKEYRPKYNIVFMDDKTYPYIQITSTTPPTIDVVRTKNVTGKLFGPYPNVKSARATARFLQLLFPMGRIEKIPNFYEEIGNKIEPDISNNYQKQVQLITRFLKGDIKVVVDALIDEMERYSSLLMFERAAVIRDQLSHIMNTTEKQIISLNDYKDRDFIGYAYNEDDIAVQILFMRNGRIIDQLQRVFSYVGDPQEYLINYLDQFYMGHFPDEILFDNTFDLDQLKNFKNPLIPQKGDKKKIVDLANDNAKNDLENYNKLYRNKQEEIFNAIDDLKEMLNLENLNLIETFDNSQLFGTAPISAMIVFENGAFNKKLYRKFHIKTTTNDDYQSLREVIYRRYQKVLIENQSKPDLILIDGGIGHIKIAKEVLEQLNLNILVAGLKKNNKHELESLVLLDKEYNIKDNRKLFKLLHSISEEVHRYAITFHRQTRNKVSYKSILDDVHGLGDIRKQRLLKEFKNLDEIKNASENKLKELGIPTSVIKNLKDVLNREVNSSKS